MYDTPQRILVVEDNAALAGVIDFNLTQSGYDVCVAEDGMAALEAIRRSEPFHMVMLDHQMPRMTGLELCAQLRDMDGYDAVPVILLTAKHMELDVNKIVRKLGIAATFAKPFSPAEVIRVVDSLLAPVG